MSRTKLALGLVLTATCLVAAEEPPYKRLLQGDDANKAAALSKRIDELWAAGKFEEAAVPAKELLALRKRVQGEGYWQTREAARMVATLARVAALPAGKQAALASVAGLETKALDLGGRGKYVEAEPLYRKALAVSEEVLGPGHPDTAQNCNNLATNLEAQGRAREAEQLHRKALAVREEALGPRHPATAQSCNNLAANLDAQGRGKEAEPLFRKTLAVIEEVQGPRSPDAASSYNNLATNLQTLGRAREAEPLLRKALDIYEEVLGQRHPHTATSYHNLAYNLQIQGRAREAEPLLHKALAIWAEFPGPHHLDTAYSYNALAVNLHAQGRVKEAEPLFRKTLAMREEVLSPRHTETAQSCNNLAVNLQAQGRAKEAEPLFRKALAVREEVLGARHPDTASGCNNLAINLEAQGRPKEAEPLLRKALAVCEEVLGPRHPDTAQSCHNLATNLHSQGQPKEAEPLLRKALAVFEKVLGPRHPDTAQSYTNLASNLDAQGRAKEAEPFWQAGADAKEAARLRLATSTLDRAAAVSIQPHTGLAACRARLGRPADAWAAAEAGLARGLLDDLAARTALPPDPDADRSDRERAARLDVLERALTPLLAREKLDDGQRRQRDELLQERTTLDDGNARAAAARSRQAVLPLAKVQEALAPDAALVFWVDVPEPADHWGCVVRRGGPPAWVRLPGSGTDGAWTKGDDTLPRLVRDDLARGEPDAERRARLLAGQRLAPLAAHLAATAELPAVRRLVVVPVGRMAGVPVEALTDRYLVSYVPSGSVLARLVGKHRPLAAPTLLALGDPNFTPADAGPPPPPPNHGLYLAIVLPGGSAARAGLRGGDVLLRYGGVKLTTRADLKLAEGGDLVPVVVWRAGKVLDDLRLAPGKLGVVVSDDPPAVALRKRRELDLLADARNRDDVRPLPGTRLEVAALTALLPRDKATLLLGSRASEQELGKLAASGQLKQFRLVHLATHGKVDPTSAAQSALLLARDRLPDPAEQGRLIAAGKKAPTGVLSVETMATEWELDADLVALSACETALGPDGGGEGLLGFAQVLLGRGARSLLLSLWKVDDTATALLMLRFYQNLLGQREGLKKPLGRAEALREAKRWLRELPRAEAEKLAGQLADGAVRASEEPKGPVLPKPAVPAGDNPFAHPRYWAAFILIGDPD